MKTSIVSVFCFLIVHGICVAQQAKPKFTSLNQVGITWGGTDQDLQLQTVNGVFYKTFSAGLGVGLDYYYERTVPVFVDLRKDLFVGSKTPFVYVDLGINMPWVKENKEQIWYKSNYDHGGYVDVGLGYKIKIVKKFFANMSIGYSQKTFREERINEMIAFDFAPHGNNFTENYKYTLRRFSVKAGLSF